MTKPLALVYYESLLPGSQLVNRLRDLGFRVEVVTEPRLLVGQIVAERPLVVLAEVAALGALVCDAFKTVRASSQVAHVLIIAFAEPGREDLQAAATAAGATLVSASNGILDQLPALLDRAWEIE